MINLNKLIDFLPYYFKEKDSYKDDTGKGLLERFLELVGEYILDDSDRPTSLMPNIDNILDIIDVDYTRAVYLDYLYEFLGSPMQDYITPTSEAEFLDQPPYYVWYLNYNVPLMDWTRIGFLGEVTVIPRKHYNAVDKRFIKYAIALYKIRGTKYFYEVILNSYFNLMGIELTEEVLVRTDDGTVKYDNKLAYDNEYQYDGLALNCLACSSFIVDLTAYNDRIVFEERARLKAWLEKYSPINTRFMVAFQFTQIYIVMDGPETTQYTNGLVTYSGDGEAVVGYDVTVKADVEIPYRFLGWFNDTGGIVSTSLSYKFNVTGETRLFLRYEMMAN